ncbi:class I adenylate-forming enzyme family protein [Mycobacterium xenopi]|uniref:O-succinylbenzoate--CoA ligase n=1 Tax=Mycobacterium xenopi TaxID=1789 RepID=A0AAD1GXE6_MYCXE|nr:fatty acid--CoA ligase family protein [Mycobacterium xenopi]MDA3642129.1 fatty acid--CoA ligase family protein [Mycobacterium xenopi]MDA3658042.1 fatty acid--CoA ligase family protein [Mycobacterium xenopi]MDA3664612.1 fatty acid--CoA ligase family protein [Mycobacterium xenopi]ORX21342.1 AMP-dependent synthetase [Mycobacterium xenopi]SPX78969.1 AMP-dependent synthetase and ligase [Mycobacterium xenopi]
MTSLDDALARLWTADDLADMLQQDGRWVRWGQVRELAERIDRELGAAGCAGGGRVAVVLGNRMESVAALIALFRAERILVTVSPLQPPHRLSADLATTGASYVLAPDKLWSETAFRGAVAELGAAGWSVDGDAVELRTTASREPRDGDPAVAIEMLTSGTTGPPKRIPLTRRQLEASLAAALRHHNRPEVRDKPPFTGAVAMVTIPIVHIGGLWALLQSLVSARRFVLLERFTVAGWHTAVKEHKPILAGLPPAAIRSVLDSDIPQEDLSSLRAVNAGTAPVDPALVDAFYERYGIPILIVYGATEFSGAVAGWTVRDFRARWAQKKGSVGRAFPGVRLRVVDDDGAVLPTGRSGRLQVASPQVGGGANRWVTTSDLAHLDEDGFLYIDGRADDVIMRGGFKIAPETVVTVLRGHDAVADAAVAGMPDQRLGQIPVAGVELRAGAATTPDKLREYCRSALAPYEVPAEIYIVDELPRGAALKIDRRQLIAMLESLREEPRVRASEQTQ